MSATIAKNRFWILALVLAIPALVPALLPGWFEGHDDLHIYRLIEYDLTMRDGQIPPRWFPDVSAGYGNPHPNFYAPLFYLTAEVFHLAGLGPIGSLKGAIAVFMFLSAAAMYGYARLFWSETAALVAAAAYTYAPYHLLDLYVRKAFSEFTVFAFIPLLLLSFHNIRTRGNRLDIIAGAASLAALSTAHTISTMMVPALLGAYGIFLSLAREGPRWRFDWKWMPRAVLAAGVGYLIAGFFLVPAFLERDLINLKIYTEAYVDYRKHFVYPQQLVWWPWGFGMSLDGLQDKMSFRLGLLQIAGTVLAVAGLGLSGRHEGSARRHAVFFIAMTCVAVFMMLPISSGVWAALPPLRFVQFPWRFLTLTTLSTSMLCAAAFAAYGPSPATGRSAAARRRGLWAAAIVCAGFTVSAAAGGMLGVNLRVPSGRVGFEEKPYNNMIDKGPDAPVEPFDSEFVRRHTLRWIDHLPSEVSFMGLGEEDLRRPPVEVEQGTASVESLVVRTDRVVFRAVAPAPVRMRVNVYRFPGWTVRVGGERVEIVEPPRRHRVVFFDLPPGTHEVAVTFEKTGPRKLGDALSLAGLAALAAIGLWPQRSGPRR